MAYPFDYMKTVLQLNKEYKQMGMRNVFKHVLNTQGIFGLYSGYTALLIFTIPNAIVRFGTFDYAQ